MDTRFGYVICSECRNGIHTELLFVDAIGVDSQLPEVDELRSCALTTRLSQLKLSIENLKEIILMLQVGTT